MRGPPSVAWTTSDEGQRQCRLDHVSGEKPSGPTKKYGDRVKNRRGGAPGGARAGHTARGTSKGCRLEMVAFRRSAPLTHVRDKGRKAPAPRLTDIGARWRTPIWLRKIC